MVCHINDNKELNHTLLIHTIELEKSKSSKFEIKNNCPYSSTTNIAIIFDYLFD